MAEIELKHEDIVHSLLEQNRRLGHELAISQAQIKAIERFVSERDQERCEQEGGVPE